jgi:hypothetical protein
VNGVEHFKDTNATGLVVFQICTLKSAVVNEISLTYKLLLRDVSGLDHPFHVNVTTNPKLSQLAGIV